MVQAGSVLETLFPGVSRARFLEEYWLGDRHLVVHADPARLAPLFDPTAFGDLREVLQRHRGNITGSLRDRRGQQCHLHSFKPDEAEALYDCGATLHLDSFETNLPSIREMSHALAAELGLAPDLLASTAFAATRPGPGSPLHSDDKDIFIVQLEGAKRWRVGPNREVAQPTTNLWPWARGGPRALRDVAPALTTIDLEPGSALFLPRSQWHETEVLTEGCFAITTGFRRPTWLQLLEVVLHNHLGADPAWRAPIGSAWGTPAQQGAVVAELATRLRGLADELGRLDAAALLKLGDQTGRGYPWMRSRHATLSIAASDDGWDVTVTRDGSEQSFAVDEPAVIELVRWVDQRTDPFEDAEVYARFGGEDRRAIRAVLVQLDEAGLIDTLPPLNLPLDLRKAR